MLTPTLYLAESFLEALDRLPQDQRKKVRDFLGKFCADPTAASINYEPIHDTRDDRVRTVRIDRTYRAVVLHPRTGADYVLVWVDHHDAAMAWAKRKSFAVNPVTGAMQVIDTEFVASLAERQPPATPKPLDAYKPFELISDADLLRTGVPAVLLPAVRAIADLDDLAAIQHYLPAEAYEALFWIAAEQCSVDQALEHAGVTLTQTAADDLTTALAHPDSRRRFHLVDSVAELQEILDAPLEKWRIFLHPSQARLVARHFNGPARVLGGAGTGKTVVAMHRARRLARDVFTAPDDRILFTTFTRNLAANIRHNLRNLCGAEFDRIEVTHFHALAVRLLERAGQQVHVLDDATAAQLWRNAVEQVGATGFTEAFLKQEWAAVVQAQGITERREYLQASRQGQSTPLNRSQRAAIWPIFAHYRAALDAHNWLEWPDVIRQARRLLATQPLHLPYRAAIVDETQDLHAEELRLVRALIPEGPNDLFFVGDAHQRIYGQPVVMAHCGIAIRGRSARLRINYRTTEQIRRWATALLADIAVDDLDGGQDEPHGYRSLLSGPPPTVRVFATQAEEAAYLIDEVRALCETSAPERICIVTRTHRQVRETYMPMLREAGLPYLILEADAPDDIGSGVRLATMHRVKGLEFEHVLIAGLNDGVMPPPGTVTEAELLRERCLLHVAASRARETLTVTAWGRLSRLV
ncbi:MAG TPA: DNA helicase [Chloroflexi bacterium]|nr:DNA helicase [Chloroflexota bacterium]HHW87585.1 UvrD-helicase domain-containing protein [Chloroflexota bacterium]